MTDVTQPSLCVTVEPQQASAERGQPAEWTVQVWATSGDLPDVTLQLQFAPAGDGTPTFSFGCGDAGTSSCDLGAVDANSAQRQLQVRLTVPVSDSTVKSVRLTVTGTAPNLVEAVNAAAAVSITAPAGTPPTPTSTPTTTAQPSTGQQPAGPTPAAQPSAPSTPVAQPAPTGQPSAAAPSAIPTEPYSVPATTSPIAVGDLPSIAPLPSATLSPGGSAASLFPTLSPSPTMRASAKGRAAANTMALPEGASVAGAQVAGLAALALGIALAVTRLSVRRRPAAPGKGETTEPLANALEEDEPEENK